ncbi:hypothetical protein KGF56_002585 [Candida oxycetoniae]|uniref:Pyridoxamine 5'-phosphate oxidase Alr4036 family FMN-binding domain-containing protein n=1 Tax=Candida oxycetoniae TaxID=497107 RepID=A0AAI9WY24_9ASCO|nr:uncharacterized protein KGF56_002585 [Candida oxycetoniae]KAI3404590.2 hypothetical protein KGF56_002585 [Candida oxycetoniae]
MVQFNYQAPWVTILNSCINNELTATDHQPPFITCQLATIDTNTGYPNNRTLVYRGWLFNNKSSNVLTFTTDKRSQKYNELLKEDKVEVVFWFSHIRKQIRFKGKARILDSEHHPIIDIEHLKSDEGMNNTGGKEVEKEAKSEEVEKQRQPIQSSLFSPTYSSNNLVQDDLSTADFIPPSSQEWDQELQRYWDEMSKSMKTSFKKPIPKSLMTEENQKLISKIHRGVDGKKDNEGIKNFAVVGIFVNWVDYYEQDKDKRFIYELEKEGHQWTEYEVCP